MNTETKIKALAEFLEVELDEIDEISDESFEYGHAEYLVLTDSEADEKCHESISDLVWAFKPEFLACHSELDAETIGIIQNAKYEDANEPLKRLIKDFDYFVSDAVLSDGRGHFLSQYDGQEVERYVKSQNGKNVTVYIFRVN